MTIYEELVKRVSEGETFHIDFEERTMKIGKQKIIDNGSWDKNRELIKLEYYQKELEFAMKTIYELYLGYKYSLPSERSDSKRRKYFKSLSVEELTDEELMTAETRDVAQCKLEGYILCVVLLGVFVWNEDRHGKWFWQSKADPDLVILRSWIENKQINKNN